MIRRAVARVLGAPLAAADRGGVADAIVVLGAPLAPGGALSTVLRERVDAAFALWAAGGAPLVCVTGGPSRGRTEADAMADALVARGVPLHALRLERAARTTAENARLVAELLAPEGVGTVWLVSQPFHLRRARWLFRRAGLNAWAFRMPERARPDTLAWILREYAAWAKALARL